MQASIDPVRRAWRPAVRALCCAALTACAGLTACGGGGGGDAASTTATQSASSATPSSNSTDIDITAHGAVCDGRVDNTAAITAAIAAAKARQVGVVVPVGSCAYGDVLRLEGVKLRGAAAGATLLALNPESSAIIVSGDGGEVHDLTLGGAVGTVRLAALESTRIALIGATRFVIDGVTILGSAAAGIQTAQAANNGRITNNRIGQTLADGIHVTDRSSQIVIEGNRVEASGDDGISVVSYRGDGGLSHHVTARGNVVLNNLGGRQMSVVGGSDVLFENNQLSHSGAFACIYIAQETVFDTFGASRVTVQNNTLADCGSTATGHGGVLVFNAGEEANDSVTIANNQITQNGQAGIRVTGALNTNVVLQGNQIQGANPALDLQTPGVTVLSTASAGAVR